MNKPLQFLKKYFIKQEGNKSTPKLSLNVKTLSVLAIILVVSIMTFLLLAPVDDSETSNNTGETDLHDPTLYSNAEYETEIPGKTKISYIQSSERTQKENQHDNPLTAFSMRGRDYSSPQVLSNSGNVIPPGTLLKTKLVNKVISGKRSNPVIAVITEDYIHLGTTAIPRGTKLLGQSQHDEESRRIQVSFHTAVFPDQSSFSFSGLALDLNDQGSAGLNGNYKSKQATRLSGTLLSEFISGFAEGMQEKETNMFGTTSQKGSVRNAILKGTSTTAIEQSRRYSEKLRETKGVITIPSGYEFIVYLEREFKFQ